jgi:cytochrome bd-type quinol oxidase subunit 2
VDRSKTGYTILSVPDELGAEFRRTESERSKKTAKKILVWIFLAQSLLSLRDSFRNLRDGIRPLYIYPAAHESLVLAALFFVVAAICGVAWWANWKREPSARAWAIAASLAIMLPFFPQFIFHLPPVWDHHVDVLIVGLGELATFAPREEQRDEQPRRGETA